MKDWLLSLISGLSGAALGVLATVGVTWWQIRASAEEAIAQNRREHDEKYNAALAILSQEVIRNLAQQAIGQDRKVNHFSTSAWDAFSEHLGRIDVHTAQLVAEAYDQAILHRQAVLHDDPGRINRGPQITAAFDRAIVLFGQVRPLIAEELQAATQRLPA